MRVLAFLALITILAVVAARVLPFFGFDPLGDAIESAYRSGALGLVVGILILWAAALIAWAVHRWNRKPGRRFPWGSVASQTVVIVVLVFVYVRYGGLDP